MKKNFKWMGFLAAASLLVNSSVVLATPSVLAEEQDADLGTAAVEEEASEVSGLVPGLVEFTVFGNHVMKPDSRYPYNNGQIFNEGFTPENAPTYCNPLEFDFDYSQTAGNSLGNIS